MLQYSQIVGNQEDWADIITNVEMMETPFLDWLPVGDKPVNVLHNYQAEKYEDPVLNAHVDGRPVSGFASAGDGRGKLIALIQYFTKTSSVTRLHQDVSNIAGIEDELGRDMVKRTKELARDIEVAFLEGTDHVEGSSTTAYKTRGVASWISNSAQSLYPVPVDFRPPTASISTTASASLTENTILDILESMGQVTKSKNPITAFPGQKAKRAFNNIPLFNPQATLVPGGTAVATGITYSKNGKTIDRIFERYMSDFGPIDLPGISWYNVALSGGTVEKAYCTYFLHQNMWQLRWGPGSEATKSKSGKPTWIRKPYEGGSYEAFCETLAMLECLNPKGEGRYQPTS